MRRTLPVAIGLTLSAAAPVALASVHFMQIEQVVVVGGDAQAIQLRMRFAGQNQMQDSRLRAWNANGSSSPLLAQFASPVVPSAAGTRVLLATPAFQAQNPGIVADFTIQPIPAAALPAGRITFEWELNDSVLWSLCWGGAAYTGPTTGALTNDSDGNFAPCVTVPLPLDGRGVRFTGASGAGSTNNLADYEITTGPATVTNSAGRSVVVVDVFGDGFE
jgi:hypothetical protein